MCITVCISELLNKQVMKTLLPTHGSCYWALLTSAIGCHA